MVVAVGTPDRAAERIRPALAYPSAARAWSTVALLLAIYILSFVDRQGISLLVAPIKQDLAITDTQMSLLIGFAFALLYTVLGLPAGTLADRIDRRLLIGGGLLMWSVATVACGLAQSFGQLFAARVGVGIGEATLMPAAFSLIRDSFAPARRGRAFSIYTTGLMVGAGTAFLAGGLLIGGMMKAGDIALPLFGVLRPWQAMLVLTGLAGLPLLLLLPTIREPARQETGARRPSLAETASVVWQRRGVCVPLFLAIACAGVAANGMLSWMPAVLGRGFHLTPRDIGVHYGLSLLILAPAGQVLTGIAMDRLAASGWRNAAPLAAAAMAVTIVPLLAFIPVAPSAVLAWTALAAYIFLGSGIQPAAANALSQVVPGRLLGQATAIYFLIITIVSVLIGPTLIAGLSDYVLGGPAQLGLSLAIVCASSTAISAALFVLTARRMRSLPPPT